ncbi:MAG: leucyl/phenylalanyl-tRNA--protein transferase [Blastocatellia bacterium]
MAARRLFRTSLTPEQVLLGYEQGMFPMADGLDGDINWYVASQRALIPLDENFRVRRSLRQVIQRGGYRVAVNTAFPEVIRACARHRENGPEEIWLSEEMIALYCEIHRRGRAHSMEIWRDDKLAGGLYGITLGGVFCGESMFSREPFGSQLALVALVERLRARGFKLLDAQILTPHLEQFGAYVIEHAKYLEMIERYRWQEPRYAD